MFNPSAKHTVQQNTKSNIWWLLFLLPLHIRTAACTWIFMWVITIFPFLWQLVTCDVFDPIVHKQRNLPKIYPWSVILPQHTELCHLDSSRYTKMDREPPNPSETAHPCGWQHLKSSHCFITLLDGLWHTNQHKAGIQHIKQPLPNVRLFQQNIIFL